MCSSMSVAAWAILRPVLAKISISPAFKVALNNKHVLTTITLSTVLDSHSRSRLHLFPLVSCFSTRPFLSYYSAPQEKANTRYREKLRILGKIADPFANWQPGPSLDWQEWPDVGYGDVFNYLIESPSIYTGELLKAYKSLDAYNFCKWLGGQYSLAGTHTWSLLWFATQKGFQPRLYKRGWQPNKIVEWFVDTAHAWQD